MPRGEESVVYHFGEFVLDPRQRLLRTSIDGRAIPLTVRVFDTLLFMVRHPGELLDKATLMKAVWQNVVVEENNLNQNVSILRRALGDGHGEHRYILTVPGRGYRFVAPVNARGTEASAASVGAEPASIAVLPFANLSGDAEKEYFSDGIAEELIHALARVPGLKVPARTSSFAYKGRNTDVRQIARELGVESVLEGNVRAAGERIRVTVQLVSGRTGYHAWSQSYDREYRDLFALQDELAASVVQLIKGSAPQRPASGPDARPTDDLEAYRLYLQARSLFSRPSEPNLVHVIRLLDQAIARDATFVRAHSLLANTHALTFIRGYAPADALIRAEHAAGRALALQGEEVEALTALGAANAARGRWIEAEKCLRTALSSNPNEPSTHRVHAIQTLSTTGQLNAAVKAAQRAQELAPADALNAMVLATSLGFIGRDEESLKWAGVAVQLGLPEHVPPIPNLRSQAARRAGAYDEAINLLLVLLPPSMRDTGHIRSIQRIHEALAAPRRRPSGIAAIGELRPVFSTGPIAGVMLNFLINWATLLEALDLAFDMANAMLDDLARTGALHGTLGPLWIPEMQPFRRDPRFAHLVRRLGWTDFWKEYGPPDGDELY